MAKFKQYKLPDGTVLLCKDEIAGKTLNFTSDRKLQLLDEGGVVRSVVTIPRDRISFLDSGATVKNGGIHKIPGTSLVSIEKLIYIVDRETGELLNTLVLVDASTTSLAIKAHVPSYASAITVAAGSCGKANAMPYYDNYDIWGGVGIYHPNSNAANIMTCKSGVLTINSDAMPIIIKDQAGNFTLVNDSGAAKTISANDIIDALYTLNVPNLLLSVEKESELFIYDVWDLYTPWVPSYTYFKFRVGGLGSHMITSIEVDKWDDATQAWVAATPVSFTQDPDTEQVTLNIDPNVGNNDQSDPTRDYLRLTVHTSSGSASIKLSPDTKIYT